MQTGMPWFFCLVPAIFHLSSASCSLWNSDGSLCGMHAPVCSCSVFSLTCKYAQQLHLSSFKTWALLFSLWLDHTAFSIEGNSMLFAYVCFYIGIWLLNFEGVLSISEKKKKVRVSFFFPVLVFIYLFTLVVLGLHSITFLFQDFSEIVLFFIPWGAFCLSSYTIKMQALRW